MKSLLLVPLLVTACATDGSSDGSVTPMPINNESGPDILKAELRCRDVAFESEISKPKMSLVVGTWFASSNREGIDGSASVMVGSSRMTFELSYSYSNDDLRDEFYARDGQEDVMRSMCDSSVVELVDVRVTAPEGTTNVPSIRVVPAWNN